jgi:hypothetical protein
MCFARLKTFPMKNILALRFGPPTKDGLRNRTLRLEFVPLMSTDKCRRQENLARVHQPLALFRHR